MNIYKHREDNSLGFKMQPVCISNDNDSRCVAEVHGVELCILRLMKSKILNKTN